MSLWLPSPLAPKSLTERTCLALGRILADDPDFGSCKSESNSKLSACTTTFECINIKLQMKTMMFHVEHEEQYTIKPRFFMLLYETSKQKKERKKSCNRDLINGVWGFRKKCRKLQNLGCLWFGFFTINQKRFFSLPLFVWFLVCFVHFITVLVRLCVIVDSLW